MGTPHGIGYGLGIGIGGPEAWGAPEGTKGCFWGGAGGSSITLDHSHRACFSYVMNQMSNDLLGECVPVVWVFSGFFNGRSNSWAGSPKQPDTVPSIGPQHQRKGIGVYGDPTPGGPPGEPHLDCCYA
ncbi:MAG: hypothetical protein CM1200mP9_06120 [Gammaproteobacteria bacterium]|nr:MAG: hypothetical protein CM1200mP9_06120 [Gammaproteobacteria bacterium]